jgi:hypothetical protein
MERTLQPRRGIGVAIRDDGAITPDIGQRMRCAYGESGIRSEVIGFRLSGIGFARRPGTPSTDNQFPSCLPNGDGRIRTQAGIDRRQPTQPDELQEIARPACERCQGDPR